CAENRPVIYDRADALDVDPVVAAGDVPGRLIDDDIAAVLKINALSAVTAGAYRPGIVDRAALRQKNPVPVPVPAAPADRAEIGDAGGSIVSSYSPKTGYRPGRLVGDIAAAGKLD